MEIQVLTIVFDFIVRLVMVLGAIYIFKRAFDRADTAAKYKASFELNETGVKFNTEGEQAITKDDNEEKEQKKG